MRQWSPVIREGNTEIENGSSKSQLHTPHFSQCPVNQMKFHRRRASFTADNTTVWVAVKRYVRTASSQTQKGKKKMNPVRTKLQN